MKKFIKQTYVNLAKIIIISLLMSFLSPLSAFGATIASINVWPNSFTVAVGSTRQLTASALEAGAAAPFNPQPAFAWASSDTAIGTVDATGLFTPIAPGMVTVTASSGGINGTATITVVPQGGPIFASISATQLATNITVGATYQLSALAVDAAGWPVSPQPTFTWTSSDTAVATVNNTGLFTAVSVGAVTITVSNSGISGTVNMTVSPAVAPVISLISVLPSNYIITVGSTKQFYATSYDSPGIKASIPQPAFAWTSSNAAVGTVGPSGIFTALAAGTSTITATAAGIQDTATITVNPAGGPTFAKISVDGALGSNIPLGYTTQLTATAWDATGFFKINPQPAFTWASSDNAVATVSATGMFRALANGAVTITASSLGVVGSRTVIIGDIIPSFAITASAGANGTISSPGAVMVNSGGNKIYTITPAAGYAVADVLVDGVSIGALTSYTFTNVTAAHTISASFSQASATLANLLVGWNLAGWSKTAITAQDLGVANIGVDLISKWDAANQLWVSHITNFPLNNFTINPGDGIFVHKN